MVPGRVPTCPIDDIEKKIEKSEIVKELRVPVFWDAEARPGRVPVIANSAEAGRGFRQDNRSVKARPSASRDAFWDAVLPRVPAASVPIGYGAGRSGRYF
jgi:hypothetical protein